MRQTRIQKRHGTVILTSQETELVDGKAVVTSKDVPRIASGDAAVQATAKATGMTLEQAEQLLELMGQ